METSNDDLLAEWDIVTNEQDIAVGSEVKENDQPEEKTSLSQENASVQTQTTVEEGTTVSEQELVTPANIEVQSGVDDIELENASSNESNTSSDIDVIDDPIMEESHHSSAIPSPLMQFSIGSSMEGSAISSSMMVNNPPPPYSLGADVPSQREDSFSGQMMCLVICISISILFMFISHAELPAEKKVSQLQEIVESLQAQNSKLRDQVTSKAEKDALLHTLEEEVSTLKLENAKMGDSMTSLMEQLEEQAAIYMKENELKKNKPYQEELDNLREEINLLKIDNDALQQQLVRLRYVKFKPLDEPAKQEAPVKKRDAKPVDFKDIDEAKYNQLLKEIKDMKEKMLKEVSSFNQWKKSLKEAMENFAPKISRWYSGPEKESWDNMFEQTKEDKQGYKWSWKDVKSNLKNTLDNLNVSDLFQKYVKVDKKKVSDAMESVGFYFRKAHEKARKVFQEDLKPDVLEFLGELKTKWNSFVKANHKTSPKTSKQQRGDQEDTEITIDQQVDENNNEEDGYSYKPEEDLKSWLFDRAEYRSKEREEEFKREVNWFLQKHSLKEGERWSKKQQEEYERDVNWFLQKHGLKDHETDYEKYVKPRKGKNQRK